MAKRIIGKLKETSLHASLKKLYASGEAETEEEIDGFIVDVVNKDILIEIQTGNFSNLKKKFSTMLVDHRILLVFPIAETRYIVRIDHRTGEVISRRKSPKKGRLIDLFNELVYVPHFMNYKNLSLEIILVEDEIILINDGKGSWRRKHWSIFDRRMLTENSRFGINGPKDLLNIFPKNLPAEFTTNDIVSKGYFTMRLAQKAVYCLYQLNLIERVGKKGRSWLYKVSG